MTYDQALESLYETLPAFHRIGPMALKPGLGNTLLLLERLGNPHLGMRCVHVAGTNGKGSSSHMLASILQEAGYKTGLYTSPHLKDYRERIRLNGIEIPKERVVQFVLNELPAAQLGITPSFFEATVALCFLYFKEQQTDIAVIEVGLGGRLDSTNVVLPDVSLITNIGYDHQELLGLTLALIAGEKAGIIKPMIPVVISERHPETESVFLSKAATEAAPIVFAQDYWEIAVTEKETTLQSKQGQAYSFTPDLTGSYQARNMVGVAETIRQMDVLGWKISSEAFVTGLENVKANTGLAGRWQVLQQNPMVIADTAHNAQGLELVFAQATRAVGTGAVGTGALYIILGVVADKNLEKIYPLLPRQAHYVFTQPSVMRAMPASVLAQAIQKETGIEGQVLVDPNQALARVLALASQEDVILITGSTFLVADIEDK